jgi:uncharacterized protein (TIGR04255 family)
VAQARHAGVHQEVTAEVVSAVQERLRDAIGVSLDRVAQLTSTNIVIGPGVAPGPTTTQPGVQLASVDGQWQATVTSEWVSLETQSFRSYAEDFRPLLAALLEAVSTLLSPVTTVRTGLRFVNVLKPPHEGPAGPHQWDRWVRPALAAAASDPWLASGLDTFSAQMLLSVAPGIHSGVQCGPIQDGSTAPAFLLDIDTFAEPQSVWKGQDVLTGFDKLNESGVALFQALITADMLDHLRGPQAGEGTTSGEDRT